MCVCVGVCACVCVCVCSSVFLFVLDVLSAVLPIPSSPFLSLSSSSVKFSYPPNIYHHFPSSSSLRISTAVDFTMDRIAIYKIMCVRKLMCFLPKNPFNELRSSINWLLQA